MLIVSRSNIYTISSSEYIVFVLLVNFSRCSNKVEGVGSYLFGLFISVGVVGVGWGLTSSDCSSL